MKNVLNNVVVKKLSIIVEPLTPIHVWSGDDAVTGIDLVYIDDKACVVDYEKIPQEVIAEALGIDINQLQNVLLKYKERIPCRITAKVVSRPAPRARVKLVNKYIIPGSSLKGYIRTAVAFHKISSMDPSRAKSALQSGIDLFKPPKNVAQGLEGLLFREPRPRKARGFVDMFQMIYISDPVLNDVELSLLEFLVKEPINSDLRDISRINVIAFTKGKLKYVLTLVAPVSINQIVNPAREHYKDLNRLTEPLKMNLLDILRSFGCHILKYELNRVQNITQLNEYVKFLQKLSKDYCERGFENECVIGRLGFMTGHQAKTILTLIKTIEPDLYNEVVSFMSRNLGRIWDERTFKLTKINDALMGIGWCKICLA